MLTSIIKLSCDICNNGTEREECLEKIIKIFNISENDRKVLDDIANCYLGDMGIYLSLFENSKIIQKITNDNEEESKKFEK